MWEPAFLGDRRLPLGLGGRSDSRLSIVSDAMLQVHRADTISDT